MRGSLASVDLQCSLSTPCAQAVPQLDKLRHSSRLAAWQAQRASPCVNSEPRAWSPRCLNEAGPGQRTCAAECAAWPARIGSRWLARMTGTCTCATKRICRQCCPTQPGCFAERSSCPTCDHPSSTRIRCAGSLYRGSSPAVGCSAHMYIDDGASAAGKSSGELLLGTYVPCFVTFVATCC